MHLETGTSVRTEVVLTRRGRVGVAVVVVGVVGVEDNGRDGDGDSAGGDGDGNRRRLIRQSNGGARKCLPGACLSEPPEVAVKDKRPVKDGRGERRQR
jgi:hypothetical protein